MEIQWSLVIFTALTGAAGWMLACTALAEFKGSCKRTTFPAAVASLALLVVGGLASVTHLSHPERMLEALNHPASGIFTEAVLVGITSVFVIAFLILVKREASEGSRKVAIAAAAVFGVVLSFSAGASYMMSARAVWNTLLLPIGYLGTAIPFGISAFLFTAAMRKEDASELAIYAKALIVGGVVAAVAAGAYVASIGSADVILLGWVLSVVVAGVAPAAIGALASKKPESALALGAASLACALIGSVAYRCLMWSYTSAVSNYFSPL